MESTYKLIWSDEALTNLKQIILYLEQKWTITEIKKFANLLDHQLFRIQSNPFLFPKSDVRENYRQDPKKIEKP